MCTILDYAQILFIDKSLEGMRTVSTFSQNQLMSTENQTGQDNHG